MSRNDHRATESGKHADGGPGTKYAILFLGRKEDELDDLRFDDSTAAIRGRLESLIDFDAVSHWKEWLGTLVWESLAEEQDMLLTRVPASRRDVLDKDNEAALSRLGTAWYALQLARPAMASFGKLRCISGSCADDDDVVLHDVRSSQEMPELVRPLYMATEAYVEATWESPDDWASRWVEMDRLLRDRGGLAAAPRILELGVVSYSQGCQSRFLEFRIPKFIRAAEAVLGLPSGEGTKKRFATRVRGVVHRLEGDAFLRWRGDHVGRHLKDLFQLRSDCVHGKVPFEEISAAGKEGRLLAARYEYAAELVARDLLAWGLSHPRRHEVFASRAALEAEWEREQPPE